MYDNGAIIDINLKVDVNDLAQIWSVCTNISSNSGNSYYKYTIDDTTIIGKYDSKSRTVTIVPKKFSNDEYFQGTLTKDLAQDIVKLCKENAGTFKGVDDCGNMYFIEKGKQHKFIAMDIVNKVNKGKNVDLDIDNDIIPVQVTLGKFIKDHSELKATIDINNLPASMNDIGKKIIILKLTGKINLVLFRDLLNQCISLGANDPMINKIFMCVK